MCHLMKKSQTQHAVRSATAARKHLAHRTTSTTSSTTHGGKMMQRTGHMLQHLYACVCVHELRSRASASRDRDKKREESTARGCGNGCVDSQICRNVDTETRRHADAQTHKMSRHADAQTYRYANTHTHLLGNLLHQSAPFFTVSRHTDMKTHRHEDTQNKRRTCWAIPRCSISPHHFFERQNAQRHRHEVTPTH